MNVASHGNETRIRFILFYFSIILLSLIQITHTHTVSINICDFTGYELGNARRRPESAESPKTTVCQMAATSQTAGPAVNVEASARGMPGETVRRTISRVIRQDQTILSKRPEDLTEQTVSLNEEASMQKSELDGRLGTVNS